MKVWNIKYCLTSGILHQEVTGTMEDRYVYTVPGNGYRRCQLKVGRDAFERFDDALKMAEENKERKIASLKRKITELEKMNLTKPKKM